MDPLSTVASVAGIISLILPVATTIKEFSINCKHQNEQVAQVLTGLSRLERILKIVKDHIGKREFHPEQASVKTEIEELVQLCEERRKDLRQEYSRFEKKTRRWEYPFRKKTLEKLKKDIDDIFNHLLRILQLLSHQDTDTVRRRTEDTHEILKLVRADQKSLSILNWLKAPDATVDLNSAVEKRHPDTGWWLFGEHAFLSWLGTDNSFLWLCGFAGSGKSILSSTTIKLLSDHRKAVGSNGRGFRMSIGFFFFTFRDDSKQDSSAMLRALILQLSEQLGDDHRILLEVYNSQYRHGTPPDKILVNCLEKLIRSFERNYLVLDALDEVPNDRDRDKVLNIISTMREWSIPGLHLLVTSRDEEDIRTSLFPTGENSFGGVIFLKNDQINVDIHSYVSESMKRDPSFEWINTHHPNGVDGVIKQVLDCAGGVFRLAECRLESLRRCPKSKKDLRRALETPPKSLDETYERMFDNIIQKGYEDQARRLFTILCLSRKPLVAQQVLDCMAVELGDHPFFDTEALLGGVTELCRIAPGLLELQDSGHGVRIAHFSVQEYLFCDRISASKARAFWISLAAAHGDIAGICIAFLQQKPDRKRPMYPYASKYWTTHAFLANPKPPALSAILSKSEEIPLNYLEALVSSHHWHDNVTEKSMCWLVEQGVPINIWDRERRTPLHYAVLNHWTSCVKAMLARGVRIVTDNRDMTPFHYSVLVESPEIAQAFLDADVSVDLGIETRLKEASPENSETQCLEVEELPITALEPEDLRSLTPLHFAALYGSERMAHFLLKQGANPNISSEHGETPLHIALKGELHRPPLMILVESDDDGSNAIREVTSSLRAYPEKHLNEWYRVSLEGRFDSLGDCFDYDEPEYSEGIHKIRQDQSEVARLILSHDSTNIHAQDNHGKTPLHVAIKVEDELSVAALLGKGANVFDTDRDGLNALHYAARTGKINLIRSVVESVHDTSELKRLGESTDDQGRNVLHHIVAIPDAVDCLIYLLDRIPVDINHLEKKGLSPLAKVLGRSIRFLYVGMAAALLARGADPTLKFTIKENGKTFDNLGLGHFSAHGYSFTPLESSTLKLLSGYGADLKALDSRGWSVLHHAAFSGSLTEELLEYLCNGVGILVDCLDGDGKKPIDYAREEAQKPRHWGVFVPRRWSRTVDLLVNYQNAKTQTREALVTRG